MMQAFYKPKGAFTPALSQIADTLTEALKASEPASLLAKGKHHQQAQAVRVFIQAARRALAHTSRLQAFIGANNTYWALDSESGGYVYPRETYYAIIARIDQWDAAVSEALQARDAVAEVLQ